MATQTSSSQQHISHHTNFFPSPSVARTHPTTSSIAPPSSVPTRTLSNTVNIFILIPPADHFASAVNTVDPPPLVSTFLSKPNQTPVQYRPWSLCSLVITTVTVCNAVVVVFLARNNIALSRRAARPARVATPCAASVIPAHLCRLNSYACLTGPIIMCSLRLHAAPYDTGRDPFGLWVTHAQVGTLQQADIQLRGRGRIKHRSN